MLRFRRMVQPCCPVSRRDRLIGVKGALPSAVTYCGRARWTVAGTRPSAAIRQSSTGCSEQAQVDTADELRAVVRARNSGVPCRLTRRENTCVDLPEQLIAQLSSAASASRRGRGFDRRCIDRSGGRGITPVVARRSPASHRACAAHAAAHGRQLRANSRREALPACSCIASSRAAPRARPAWAGRAGA